MSGLTLRKWDSAQHLKTEEDMAQYLEACLQDAGDDAAFIAKALGNIARAKGMSQLSRDTGLGRESLYKALQVRPIKTLTARHPVELRAITVRCWSL
jgi:probable addiction module antidote protein